MRYECKTHPLYHHRQQWISLLVFSSLNFCFLGGFWCSFGLQRAWKTTSAPGRTNSKDQATFVATFCALNNFIKLISSQEEEGDPSSYADMDMGFRVSKCCCLLWDKYMSSRLMTTVTIWTNESSNMFLILILRLSLAPAIVWMVKQKGLSPALPLLAQVTSKGEKILRILFM